MHCDVFHLLVCAGYSIFALPISHITLLLLLMDQDPIPFGSVWGSAYGKLEHQRVGEDRGQGIYLLGLFPTSHGLATAVSL